VEQRNTVGDAMGKLYAVGENGADEIQADELKAFIDNVSPSQPGLHCQLLAGCPSEAQRCTFKSQQNWPDRWE